MVTLRSATEIATMREAGRIVARVLAAVAEAAKPGVRLIELDELAHDLMTAANATSSFRGYKPAWAPRPYPGVLCLSVNSAIVHGIPDDRALRSGDLLSIDFGTCVDGYHGDAALTVGIGQIDDAGQRLIEATAEALRAGIDAARPGARLGDIGHAVQTVARKGRYGQPPSLGGHGIGTAMHDDPFVANTGRAGRGMMLQEGLVIAIEPMFIEGGTDARVLLPDGWTIATHDGSRAAHFEHTIAITADGAEILTLA